MGLSPLFAGVASVCRDCPNRKPVSLEGLALEFEARLVSSTINGFERGQNSAYRHAIEIIKAYEKELNQ
jgi:hypothetical protein